MSVDSFIKECLIPIKTLEGEVTCIHIVGQAKVFDVEPFELVWPKINPSLFESLAEAIEHKLNLFKCSDK